MGGNLNPTNLTPHSYTHFQELMREFLERERKKQAEREAEKAAKASATEAAPSGTDGAATVQA